ncbi:MAG: 50S ribosomal protein L25 [Candidatus Pacebacteria bacterium]|nr:50S ribosomal protein L25 [Candidatus Paceibacterota bacterium]MDD5356601.1 50S ribosomal protein L25 [Candidatus Paceibacterota bacterium]
MLKLDVEKRESKISAEKLRESGKMPAVFYGRKVKSTPVSVSQKEFIKVWKKVGESSVFTVQEGKEEHDALIQDVDLDPIKSTPRHADFYIIEKGQKLKVKVPIEFVGVAPAVKDLAGILVKVLHELELEAEPKNLPHVISVDIAALVMLDSRIVASDIKLPANVSLVTKPDEVVASVAVAKEEVEEAPVDLSAIEMSETKGIKPDAEGAEGAPAEAGKAPAGKEGGKPEVAKKEVKKG